MSTSWFDLSNEEEKYLTITAKNESQKLPFNGFLLKTFVSSYSKTAKAKLLRNGSALIHVKAKSDTKKLLEASTYSNGLKIIVQEHKKLNYSKGVINCRDLCECSEEEIQKNLEDQFVTKVKRMYRNKGNVKTPTNTYILEFEKTKIPEKIIVGYLHVPVRQYIPNPLICFNCCRYGHVFGRCEKPKVCRRCGDSAHSSEVVCTAELNCVNCGENHSSMDKKCAEFLKNKEILKISVIEKIPFALAEKKI